jgi:glycosyltransferase involved in cell wall biosynthesis
MLITTYNRLNETKVTLASLEATTDLEALELAIFDNGSDDGTQDWLKAWAQKYPYIEQGNLYLSNVNIGCPKALNVMLEQLRKPGQPVIKVDNDVLFTEAGWLERIQALIGDLQRAGVPASMLSAYYENIFKDRHHETLGVRNGYTAYQFFPAIGHCVYHAGPFMDEVGFFDVLRPEHLYGFEDLLMSHKANLLQWPIMAWEGWQIENIQRHNSLGARRDRHIEAMRPFYNRLVRRLQRGGSLYVGVNGAPAIHPDRKKVFPKGGEQ